MSDYTLTTQPKGSNIAELSQTLSQLLVITGPWDRDVCDLFSKIGNAYSRAAKIPEALAMYEKDLQIAQYSLESSDPRVAGACYNVGLACCKLGRFGDAHPHLEAALRARTASLGPQHPDVADVLTCIAGAHSCSGRHADALELYARAAAIRAAALGPADPSVALSLRSAAVARACLGDFGRAAEDCRRAHEILASSLGPEHATTAEAGRLLGEISSGILGPQVSILFLLCRFLSICCYVVVASQRRPLCSGFWPPSFCSFVVF